MQNVLSLEQMSEEEETSTEEIINALRNSESGTMHVIHQARRNCFSLQPVEGIERWAVHAGC